MAKRVANPLLYSLVTFGHQANSTYVFLATSNNTCNASVFSDLYPRYLPSTMFSSGLVSTARSFSTCSPARAAIKEVIVIGGGLMGAGIAQARTIST